MLTTPCPALNSTAANGGPPFGTKREVVDDVPVGVHASSNVDLGSGGLSFKSVHFRPSNSTRVGGTNQPRRADKTVMGALWRTPLRGHNPYAGECKASPAADRATDPVEDPRSVIFWVRTAAAGLVFILTVRSGRARRGCPPRPGRAAAGRGRISAAWCGRPRARADTGPGGSARG